MKIAAFILSFLVLILSVTPCCTCNDDCASTTEKKSDNKQNGCLENCSPFYACGSCTGFVFSSPLVITIATTAIPIKTAITDFTKEIAVTPFVNKILQPPRIA